MRGFTLFAAGLLSDRRFTSPVVSPEANRCVESRCGERSARPAWRPWAGPAFPCLWSKYYLGTYRPKHVDIFTRRPWVRRLCGAVLRGR